MSAARAQLEALLRDRKLDTTLTTAAPWRTDDAARRAPTEWPVLDRFLGGGLRRGHLSEIIGVRSSGRTALLCRIAAATTARGELVAVVDTHDRFDPASAAAAGVDVSRLLWVRAAGDADRALQAMTIVLQAGGFGLVAWDLADLRGAVRHRWPATTWMRLARTVDGSLTVALLLAGERLGRSAGGATVVLDAPASAVPGEWHGTAPRARRLAGLTIRLRVIAAHGVASSGE
jgi:recombination protein RecA